VYLRDEFLALKKSRFTWQQKAKLETIATSNTEESKADKTKATRKKKPEPTAAETVCDFDSMDLNVFS